ncbi:MAG: hypothetical protein ACI8RZ_002231 [Myxococcota bacterium]|jgi:hypothetical protein
MLLLTLLTPLAAAEDGFSPLRVFVDCQSSARVDACTYLLRAIDNHPALIRVPRSDDQVTVQLNVTTVALIDRVNLRYLTELPGAPGAYERTFEVDSRDDVDTQVVVVERALLQGLSVYMALTWPDAVSVTLAVPEASSEAPAEEGSPWGVGLYAGTWGSWTENYQYFDIWSGLYLNRILADRKQQLSAGGDYDLSRQPALEVEDSSIELESSTYAAYGRLTLEQHLSDFWSVGALLRGGHQDPEGQYRGTGRGHLGISRDWFASDDPRGNRLAVGWLVGGQYDNYNQINALGEDTAAFLTHALLASGSVRFNTQELGTSIALQSRLLRPLERNVLSANVNSSLYLGDRVDLNFSLDVTRQAIPGPAAIDTSNFEAVTRADYAEPLQVNGYVNLDLHWDPTNGVQNNRFNIANRLGSLSNL